MLPVIDITVNRYPTSGKQYCIDWRHILLKSIFHNLCRSEVPPFSQARKILEPLSEKKEVKSETPDILHLCHLLSTEVLNLSKF